MAFVNGDAVISDEWKKVQEKTFTRWCNEQLKVNNTSFDKLSEGFSDGIKLIMLLEILSQKKVGRYNKNTKIRAQKLENVQQSLDFLKKEKVKLVNIRSPEIVDGNIKLILGLVWTLILHYQISLGFKDNSGLTPRQALLKWLQDKLKNRPVGPPKNLTSDWTDGLRLAALCDEIAPGLFPDADSLKSANAFENVREGIEQAHDHLDVPKLMNPEDIANPNIDEKSMMTYLSEFIDAKLTKPLPLIDGVKVYGPGVESQDLNSGEPTHFSIDATALATHRMPRVKVLDSENSTVPIKLEQAADGTYTCQYQPSETGEHQVHVTFGNAVKGSPFCTFVQQGKASNISKIRVYGEGVESNKLDSHKTTQFYIDTNDLEGDINITINGPDGVLTPEEITVTRNNKGLTSVEYTPRYPGTYNIEVLFDNEEVSKSPFSVQVLPLKEADATKVRITGKGIEKGIVNEPLAFCIDTRAAGFGNLDMTLEGPTKCEAEYNDNGNGTCDVVYTPKQAGDYKIALKFNDKEVNNSPFTVKVFDPSKVVASGSGIDGVGARKNEPADIFLDLSKAGEGDFKCSVQGPDGEKEFEVTPTAEDGKLHGSYMPTKPGDYNVTIKMEGYDIPGSPFLVTLSDLDSLKLSGPALRIAYVNEPTHVVVDSSDSGKNTVSANLVDPNGKRIPTNVTISSETVQKVEFEPKTGGVHKLNINYGGCPLPCDIKVLDPSRIKAYGPGLQNKGNFKNEVTEFIVETGGFEADDLKIKILNTQSGEEIQTDTKKLGEDKFEISYTPTEADVHEISIYLADVEVCGSPYSVGICDPSGVKAYGPGLEKGVEKTPTEFFVELSKAGEGSLGVSIDGPEEINIIIEPHSDNVFKLSYTPERAGVYDVNITFCDRPIESSPFSVPVSRGPPDASKCIPMGIDETGTFAIDAKDAGGCGLLEVGVCGPNSPCDFVSVKHNGDFTFNVNYALPEPGKTTINVKWHGDHIPGSPFNIVTTDN